MQDDLPIFPVATITTASVAEYGVVLVRFDFLTHESQSPDEAQQGRTYALTIDQARYLIQKISENIRALESAGPQSPSGTRQ